MRGRRGGSIPIRGRTGVPATGCTFRGAGDAGATSGVGVLAIFRAVGDAGAQMRHTLAFRGSGDAGGGYRPIALFRGTSDAAAVSSSASAYPNGFKNYLEFLIPEGSVFGTGAPVNYLGCIDETFPELRTVANGGLVEHASGFDMQLELADGTVVPFARLLWDAATGRIVARPRFASLPTTGARFRLFFGKTVSVDGANEGGAYAAHLAAPNIRTGADRTGLARAWTPTGITAGTLAGFAATFNGTSSQLVRTGPTELNGLGAITIQALVQLAGTAADKPIFIAGPNTGSDFGLHLRFRVADGRLVFTIQVGTSNTTVESQDDVMPAIGTPMLVAATWASGQAPKLYANGEITTLAVPGTSLTGTTNATLGAAASEALIGFNRATSNRWNGQIADLMVSARALTGGHLQTQELQYLTPRQSYGVGAANSANEPNLSPVVPPIVQTATVGSDAEVDPAALAYEPEGQPKTLTSHDGVAGGGTFSIVSGRARFRPSAVGRWLSTAAVVDNGVPPKRSLGLILWAAAAAPVIGTPKYPPEPTTVAKIRTVGYSRGDGSTQYSTIDAALNAVNPGDTIFLDDRDWGAADFRTSRDGAAGQHVVIRSRTHKGAILRGTCVGFANYYWWHGLTLAHGGTDPDFKVNNQNAIYELPEIFSLVLYGHHQNVTRCNIRASNGIWIHETSNNNDALNLPNFKTHHHSIAYCSFPNDIIGDWGDHTNIYMGRFPNNSGGPYNIEIAYNLCNHDRNPTNGDVQGPYFMYTGNSHPFDFPVGNEATNEFHHNYIKTRRSVCYQKRGMNFRYNYMKVSGANDQCLNLRHGGRSKRDGSFLSAVPPVYIEGNLFDDGGIKVSDTDYIIRFNGFTGTYRDIQLMCGQARNTSNDGTAQAALRTLLVGNQNVRKYVIGFLQSNFHLDTAEGGKVDDVMIYRGGQTINATHITEGQMEVGGYQILDGIPAGTSAIAPITQSALLAVCGCDIP